VKVEARKMKIGVLLVAVLVVSFLVVYFYENDVERKNGIVAEAGNTYALAYPVFGQADSAGASFLDEEAGISIYLNVGLSIDLSKAKTVYRTIETDTSNYTIGSIALPSLPESEDVHCFVYKDGWIVVYYLKYEPVGKIIDWSYWSGGQLTKNKLQVGLEQMCNALGVSVAGAKYYHFQYPYANRCMMIIEDLVCLPGYESKDNFTITIPSEFTVYERSWSNFAQYSYYGSYFKIDGNTIDSISSETPLTNYGTLTVAQLSPDVVHTVSILAYYGQGWAYDSCIVLTYQEP